MLVSVYILHGTPFIIIILLHFNLTIYIICHKIYHNILLTQWWERLSEICWKIITQLRMIINSH